MALPAAFPRDNVSIRAASLRVSIIPGDPDFDIELQRTVESAGVPDVGSAVTLLILHPAPITGIIFTDKLPDDGVVRFYRYRHVREGWTAGPWSSWSNGAAPRSRSSLADLAKGYDEESMKPPPTSLPGGLPRDYPLSDGKYALKASDPVGKETDDDLFVSSSKTVKVGTVASPSSLTKTIRIPAAELVPRMDTDQWNFVLFYVTPSGAVTLLLDGAMVVPKGVTITKFRARLYRQTSSDGASAALHKITGDASSSIGGVIHNSTGWVTFEASLSQLVGDEAYAVFVTLINNAATGDAKYQWAEIEYTMPSYDKGY